MSDNRDQEISNNIFHLHALLERAAKALDVPVETISWFDVVGALESAVQRQPVAYVHPNYLNANALGFDASRGRLVSTQIPLFTEPGVVAFEAVKPSALKLYQASVGAWLLKCFGSEVANDVKERCFRFQEEANELVQCLGLTREEAHKLVDYTWGREKGEPHQELGGVMTTLAALCYATGLDIEDASLEELERVNRPEIIQRIRQKQKTKPHKSPLPGEAG